MHLETKHRPFRRPARLSLTFWLLLTSSVLVTFATLAQDVGNFEDTNKTGQSPSMANLQRNSQENNEARASEALDLIRGWSIRFGSDIFYGTREATCLRALQDHFNPAKSNPARRANYKASIESIDWTKTHADIVKTISNTMGWHKSAVEAIASASESLAAKHTNLYDEKNHFDYTDVHRLLDIDEIQDMESNIAELDANEMANSTVDGMQENSPETSPDGDQTPDGRQQQAEGTEGAEQLGQPAALVAPQAAPNPTTIEHSPPPSSLDQTTEWQTPQRYLKLSRHPNFDVPINTEESAVHVPVHIYPGDPTVMNGIAWSQELTKVFRDNFVSNPKLTNQYFASQTGFMRLFPAQKWQIPRTDPDLYDARVRPWYVAAASSRKDVIMLVDSSGSMTGSRRDIAKGVVFEILDTLTDNDHFLILKFNDAVQQVGVPSCDSMRVERDKTSASRVPLKNTMMMQQDQPTGATDSIDGVNQLNENGTDIDSLYLLPATGRNVRYIKSNFTIPTSGIANFGRALVTAFEVLRKYQDTKELGSQCNQAIMLITDGSPSDFADIFDRYNYPNAPVRVFTYLIGREAGDGTHTKMMACHNRGFYTHVINLAEVRETIQQYIPVMARPLVLNRTHPITWTPAYAELTYQILTDWIWESRRREKARNVLAMSGRSGSTSSGGSNYVPDIRVTSDSAGGQAASSAYNTDDGSEPSLESELDALDLFGYESNPDCFWETRRNDLLTTVVQPVYDTKNESLIVEKYLNKNIWFKKTTTMRTANLLGVAAADMKINDIIGLAPSHKLGSNGYAVMLTNNGLIMHHPDLRSILEPFTNEPAERNSRILKPFFSSLDFIHLEHILNHESDDAHFLTLRREAVAGLTGWRELLTKRTIDCQRRVQTRRQKFFYKPLEHFPFSFLIAIPEPYGSYRVQAQVELKNLGLPEKLTTYFTTSDYDLWTVHPDYQYCEGPSNNTVTTLLDMFQRIEEAKLNDIQWRVAESSKPPVFLPDKIICDKDLVQSLVYDAVATFGFAETCGQPAPDAESALFGMFGIRFSFVSTRSGLTRVRQYDADDMVIKKEALAFAKKHARAIDETFYSRTVDYNMLVNESAVLIQVPFNTHLKIADLLAIHEREHPDDNEEPLTADTGDTSSSSPSPADVGGQTGSSSTRLSVKDMNLMEKLEILTNSSLHAIATQSIVVHEGNQKAVAGVTGAFYDYAAFVMRFLNSTRQFEGSRTIKKPATCFGENPTDKSCDTLKAVRCGLANDTIDCLLVDNNGYILASEDLDFIGRHLKAYEPTIMSRLVRSGVFHEINITDYQSICMRQGEDKTPNAGSSTGKSSSASSSCSSPPSTILTSQTVSTVCNSIIKNALLAITHTWTILAAMASLLVEQTWAHSYQSTLTKQQQALQPMLALIPNKTYLRPCERILTRYETRPGIFSSDTPEYFTTQCDCPAWFVYEQVPKTNLIMLIVDTTPACRGGCEQAAQVTPETVDDSLNTRYNIIGTSEEKVCSMLERESKLYTKRLDSCFAHHPEEEQIKLCGGASRSRPISNLLIIVMLFLSYKFYFSFV